MPRVVHFEIHAENPEETARFYSEIFGWQFQKWQGPVDYWVITTGPDSGPGINGGMVRRRGAIDGEAVIAYVCTIDVENVDDVVGRSTAAGATVALPKMAIPGVGWLAYLKDPAGNIFGVMQSDVQAS
jgi:predicted enzyme related to lactoylglutathione lyase